NPTSRHPLMRDLTALDQIAFSGGFRFDPRLEEAKKDEEEEKTMRDAMRKVVPSRNRLLEAGGDVVLMFVLQRRAFSDLVLTFPLHPLKNDQGEWIGVTSTWPLQLSFPIFLRSVLYQLGNVSDAAAEENVRPGELKVIRPESPVERVEVTDPKGGM